MRFALLGDHADGLDMARALAESGRHELAVYSGPPGGADTLRRWNVNPDRVGDIEEVLADPRIDAVIVAGSPANRPAQLRRALQSERHVLCVHPADQNADTAYEAAMLQADTRHVAFPLLPEALHPGFRRLADWIRSPQIADSRLQIADLKAGTQATLDLQSAITTAPQPAALGLQSSAHRPQPSPLRLIEVERWSTERVLLETETPGQHPSFPGWNVLRFLGGEIAEVTAFAEEEEVPVAAAVVVSGRFEQGGMFHQVLLPNQPESRWRVTVVSQRGRAELIFSQGWPGPATFSWSDDRGEGSDSWDSWNPWPALVTAWDDDMSAGTPDRSRASVTWRDEIRCLELDAAARRSIERRRSSTLEYQEATEEAGFKGTMTLVGCGLIWFTLVLLILSAWLPWMGWLIVPVMIFFLLMQLLRWLVPPPPAARATEAPTAEIKLPHENAERIQ